MVPYPSRASSSNYDFMHSCHSEPRSQVSKCSLVSLIHSGGACRSKFSFSGGCSVGGNPFRTFKLISCIASRCFEGTDRRPEWRLSVGRDKASVTLCEGDGCMARERFSKAEVVREVKLAWDVPGEHCCVILIWAVMFVPGSVGDGDPHDKERGKWLAVMIGGETCPMGGKWVESDAEDAPWSIVWEPNSEWKLHPKGSPKWFVGIGGVVLEGNWARSSASGFAVVEPTVEEIWSPNRLPKPLERLRRGVVLGGHCIGSDRVLSTFVDEGPASKEIWPPDRLLKVFEGFRGGVALVLSFSPWVWMALLISMMLDKTSFVDEGLSHSGGDCKLGMGWRWDEKVGSLTGGPKVGREVGSDKWPGFVDRNWPRNNPMSCPRSEAYDGNVEKVLSFMRRSIKPPWFEPLLLSGPLEKLNEPKLTSVVND